VTYLYTPKDAVLDVVAVLLIIAPEPVTTPIGISLLLRKRGANASVHHDPTHPIRLYPEYHYRVDNIRGREITWEVRTIMPGQLPLSELNKPAIKIKPKEQYYYPQMAAAGKPAPVKLPPGVKVHHEIYRPSPIPLAGRNVFIPGETIHHTLRELPQGPTANRQQSTANIHHTIENSPGYIKAQHSGIPESKAGIIHHTIQGSPGVQHGNPANIVKPVNIVEHHEINKTPPININGRMVRPPSKPSSRPNITGRNKPDSSR
jgi:hypothetical protein